ncbi:hypothetical protein LTS18_012715, partial [Coniosporium uncinatum]
MPPKPDTNNNPTFTEDHLAVLVHLLRKKSAGGKLATSELYGMLSAVDGARTASSFKHQFRGINKKADELKRRKEGGEAFVAVTGTGKRGS